jgi:hypothetical protein
VNLVPWLPWLVFAHVLGAFLFVLAHGVSAFVAFRVRRERDPARIAALLDLSGASLGLAFVALLLLLVAGIVTGIVKGSFGQAWIWLSIAVLVVVAGAMTPLGSGYYGRIRGAVARQTGAGAGMDPDPSAGGSEELEGLLETRRPEALAVVGGGGFLIVLWLMMFRPF